LARVIECRVKPEEWVITLCKAPAEYSARYHRERNWKKEARHFKQQNTSSRYHWKYAVVCGGQIPFDNMPSKYAETILPVFYLDQLLQIYHKTEGGNA